jgi:predicted enzyme related to lactoylglutathione lyase
MRIRRIGWFGTRTDRFAETVEFFGSVLGLQSEHAELDFAMFSLPDADADFVEVFGPSSSGDWPAAGTGAIVGFVVDDVVAAQEELAARGATLVGDIEWLASRPGYGWFYLRAPDGGVYAIVQGSQIQGAKS